MSQAGEEMVLELASLLKTETVKTAAKKEESKEEPKKEEAKKEEPKEDKKKEEAKEKKESKEDKKKEEDSKKALFIMHSLVALASELDAAGHIEAADLVDKTIGELTKEASAYQNAINDQVFKNTERINALKERIMELQRQ